MEGYHYFLVAQQRLLLEQQQEMDQEQIPLDSPIELIGLSI